VKRFLFLACVLLAPVLFWCVAYQQSLAHLSQQSARDQYQLARGHLPLAFDFSDARHLMRKKGEGASFTHSSDSVLLQSTSTGFDLRLDARGAALSLADVTALHWSFRADHVTRWWWIVQPDGAHSGWIAALPENTQNVPISALRFARESARDQFIDAAQLPPIRYMRLYGQAQIGTRLAIQTLEFTASKSARIVQLQPGWSRPEALLLRYEQLRARGVPVAWNVPLALDVSGRWHAISRFSQAGWCALILLSIALATLMWRKRSAGTRAALAALLGVAWIPLAIQLATASAGWSELELYLCIAVAGAGIAFALNAGGGNALQRAGWGHALRASCAVILILVIAFGIPNRLPDWQRLFAYLAFAALQQLLLQKMLLARFSQAMPERAAMLLAAVIFALWHTPNFGLMCLSFIAALLWCALYLRDQALSPLIVSHLLLGWFTLACVPTDLLRNTQVGSAFFEIGQSSR
jgi:membrane protease YdiL (CAAX protease family)